MRRTANAFVNETYRDTSFQINFFCKRGFSDLTCMITVGIYHKINEY